MFWEQIYFKTDEYTSNTKEGIGHCLGVSPYVGDKLTYFIYCPDNNCIVSCSNIWSADPFRGGIVNKRLDPDVYSEQDDSDMLLGQLSDSGEMKKVHQEATGNQNSGEHHIKEIHNSSDEVPITQNQDSGEHHVKEIHNVSDQVPSDQNQDSGEHNVNISDQEPNSKGTKQKKQPRKKKVRYLIKGMTRDDYNEKVVEILWNKANIQTQQKRKKAHKNKDNPRRLARTYGNHDKVSIRSTTRIKQVSAKNKKNSICLSINTKENDDD